MSEVFIEEVSPDGITHVFENTQDQELFMWIEKYWSCKCGKVVSISWDDLSYGGMQEVSCDCGEMYNTFGTPVTGSLGDIDPADAGEEW